MVKAFVEKVFDVIEAEPDRLREVVTGIGVVREAKRITDAWAELKIIRKIMVFLHSNEVGTRGGGSHLQDLRRGRRDRS